MSNPNPNFNSAFQRIDPTIAKEFDVLMKKTQERINGLVMDELKSKMGDKKVDYISWELNLLGTTMAFCSNLLINTVASSQRIVSNAINKAQIKTPLMCVLCNQSMNNNLELFNHLKKIHQST